MLYSLFMYNQPEGNWIFCSSEKSKLLDDDGKGSSFLTASLLLIVGIFAAMGLNGMRDFGGFQNTLELHDSQHRWNCIGSQSPVFQRSFSHHNSIHHNFSRIDDEPTFKVERADFTLLKVKGLIISFWNVSNPLLLGFIISHSWKLE